MTDAPTPEGENGRSTGGKSAAGSPLRSHGRLAATPSLKPRELMTDTPRIKGAWCARIITLFPEAFPGTLGLSLTGKALAEGLWALETYDLRRFGAGAAGVSRGA